MSRTHDGHDPIQPRSRRRPGILPGIARLSRLPHSLSVVVFLFLLLAQSATAASIVFENCLTENYLAERNPKWLQWVPLHVEATFDTERDDHTLFVASYGDVDGTFNKNSAPRKDNRSDPYWRDDTQIDWKIPRVPDPLVPHPKAATLMSRINVLTYEPYIKYTDFCNESLRNGMCPLGPTFMTMGPGIPYMSFPSVAITAGMNSSYAFTSFSATFLIKYGDDVGTHIGCVSATITPDLGNLAWLLKFLPLMVLVVVGASVIYAAIWSQWGSMDIFNWSSNYGRDPLLLRLVTPGFGDCLFHIQFICLTAGLTLNYPGFYQPIASQGGWSALMFNHSIASHKPGHRAVQDGIYVTNGAYGLQRLAQLVGMSESQDIWAGMMVWLLVIIAGTFVLCQLGFGIQWIYRFIRSIPEEDHRAKNIPFSVGNVVRIVFNYFLLPIVTFSTFQFVVAGQNPAYIVAMAALTLAVIIVFGGWLLYLIMTTKPRPFLFEHLPTVLLYGPLYNTYSDEGAFFALVPIMLSFIRGIAIGAVQPSGIAQVILLAICEIIQLLTIQAFRPFPSESSMNAFHGMVSGLRLVTVLLMIAFIPALGVTEGPRGWVGYAILLIHAGVLVLAFFLLALKTVAEVTAHLSGAGGFDVTGQTRGGLSKIFGVRQLSRRVVRRAAGASSRQSQLSSAAMIDAEDASKGGSGYIMPGGRLRSESAGSMGVLLNNRGQRSSSALGSIDVAYAGAPGAGRGEIIGSGASSAWTPTTPGEISNFSFLPGSPGQNRKPSSIGAAAVPASADPYYRPPRRTRRATGTDTADRENASTPAERTRRSWVSADWSSKRHSQAGASAVLPPGTSGGETLGPDHDIERGATPGPYAQQGDLATNNLAPRADYSTREVDFYYGVRGERLNSDAPNRKLGTGPADPTGPMASAAGWWRTMLGGGKKKEKGKGFEVVRSSRMPPGMMMAGASGSRGGEDEGPPEGVPVAMGTLRSGPIESDDEDEREKKGKRKNGANLLDEDGNPQGENGSSGPDDRSMSRGIGLAISDAPPMLGDNIIDAGGSIHLPSRLQSTASRRPGQGHHPANIAVVDHSDGGEELLPDVPRKSSRRHSNSPAHSRLPSVDPPQLTTDHHPQPHTQYLNPNPAAGSSSRLPFQRSDSQKRLSSASSSFALDAPDNVSDDLLTQEEQAQLPRGRNVHPPQHQPPQAHHNHPYGQYDLDDEELRRPTSFGHVRTGSVERVDRHPDGMDLLGREAQVELVDADKPTARQKSDLGR